MCWNLDDSPVPVSLDDKPATAEEVGQTLIELVLIAAVFFSAVGLADALFGR